MSDYRSDVVNERGSKDTEAIGLLKEVAAMLPIQDDHNEDVLRWCAFCKAEAGTRMDSDPLEHALDCLWVRVNDFLKSERGEG